MLWTFKASLGPVERAALVAEVRGLKGRVPSLRTLAVGENISPVRAQGYTHVLVETFDDRAGLAEYASDPAHLPVLAKLGDAAERLIAVDLEG